MHSFVHSIYLVSTMFVLAAAAFLSFACGSHEKTNRLERVSSIYSFENKLAEPFGVAVHKGIVYVSNGQGGEIISFVPGSAEIRTLTGSDTPSGITIDPEGFLLVADPGTNSIKRVGPTGLAEVIAGREGERGFADGDALSAMFNGPVGVAAHKDGRIAVADTYNDRIRIIENGYVRTIAGSSKGFSDGVGGEARFDTPLGIAFWHEERLLVADSGNRRIRVVEPDGRVWTLAGDGQEALRDGTPREASFVMPTAVAVDAAGAIYVADGNAIRAIGRRSLPFVETISGGRRGFRNGPTGAGQFNRPSGIAVGPDGELYIADSENGLVRKIDEADRQQQATNSIQQEPRRFTAEEFRELQPGRWPYDPPERTREIAGTLGEIRGEIIDETSEAWFHNGLDIPGGYGETARFIRSEKVLDPAAAAHFGTPRELIRMPTIGYVHIRLGRDNGDKPFNDSRFQFYFENGRPAGVRIARGTRFLAGEPIGTLNNQNHVHLIAGRPGAEMNALDALVLPGVSDTIPPVIEEVRLYDESWSEKETKSGTGRIILNGRARVVVSAHDRKDGNAERRRLAPYKIGYHIAPPGSLPEVPAEWNISFSLMPPHDAVKYVYARGSRSGATGPTFFNFIATNHLDGERFGEGFIDPATLDAGVHLIRVYVQDFFGNISTKDIEIEVVK